MILGAYFRIFSVGTTFERPKVALFDTDVQSTQKWFSIVRQGRNDAMVRMSCPLLILES